MDLKNIGFKDLQTGLFAIIISIIAGIIIYFVSLLFKIYPSSQVEIDFRGIATIHTSTFSPLSLSFIFMGIVNTSAYYRLRDGLRVLDLDSHYGTSGTSLLIISSVFLLFGNAGLVLSLFLSSVTNIVVLAWIAFMIVSIVFSIAGNLLLGFEFRNIGKLYSNNLIRNGGYLIATIIISYIGYILAYLGVRRISNTSIEGQVQYSYVHYQYTQTPYTSPSPTNQLPKLHQASIQPQPTYSLNYQTQPTRQVNQQNIPQPSFQQRETQPNTPIPPPRYTNVFQISGYGIMKSDGSVYLTVNPNSFCKIVSAKISKLPYQPIYIQPQDLQPHVNQNVTIKFDKIATLGLIKGKEYEIVLAIKIGDTYAPDQSIKVKYEP